MRRIVSILTVSAAVMFGGMAAAPALASDSPQAASPARVRLPNSMAAAGDSITRAFDVSSSCVLSDCPAYSWSTGTEKAVVSQYRRILTVHHKIRGHAYNDAATGAAMADLDGQLETAASQQAQYVTILMGANDLCTSSPSTMTPTAVFQQEFEQALTDFTAAEPDAKVFVSSIPNIYQLWQLLHDNPTAEFIWSTFGICQSMLSQDNTEADRQLVVAQEEADNGVLASVCAEFTQCRWDNLATYDTAFTTADISTVDYFHPSVVGQAKLAAVTWSASYWPTKR